jgi:hypothetical protein
MIVAEKDIAGINKTMKITALGRMAFLLLDKPSLDRLGKTSK